MPEPLIPLDPEEELQHLREELGIQDPLRIMDRIIGNFDVLQARAGMMVSLVALCLTISGFSGHRIASSGMPAAILMSLGLLLALISAALLLSGPLQLRWASLYRHPDGIDARIVSMIRLRNLRTHRYQQAAKMLILGLTCYLAAVILSLFPGGA
jgi:hypothetical protein